MKHASIALLALIVFATCTTAQVPTSICQHVPFSGVVAARSYVGVMWDGDVPSTKFTLECFESWFNNTSDLIRTSMYVYCGAPSFTQGAHILLGQLPSSVVNAPMTFTCPVPGTFFVIMYNDAAVTVTFTFSGTARTANGDAIVGKAIASRP